jgi:superoxide dismutase, Fe-Mn family
MKYEQKDYSALLGAEGFSDILLNNHFKLYAGYVKRTNAILERLKEVNGSEYAELKRRVGWEFNGMRLHELYFGNLVKGGNMLPPPEAFQKIAESNWASHDEWKDDFLNTGKMPGIGWVVMAYDKTAGKILNLWVNEHDVGHLAGCVPLLVMDVFEHAFITDYGLDKASYIEAFMKNINWGEVYKRFESA